MADGFEAIRILREDPEKEDDFDIEIDENDDFDL